MIKDESPNSLIVNNKITNVVGGMGIGGNATTLGNPTNMSIVGNYVSMSPSTINFEGIGITKECNNSLIAENVIIPSYDNGISASASNSTVVRNYISSSYNHGIAIEGSNTVVASNEVHDIGKQNTDKNESLEYGGIAIENGEANYIGYNTISGGQMTYAIKLNRDYKGKHYIGNNNITGFTKAYLSREKHETDVVDGDIPLLDFPLLSEEERNVIGTLAGPTD